MRKVTSMFVAAGLIACGFVGFKANAAADTTLQPGATAPNFSLPSQTDTNVSLKDYKGKYVVLYFYPKDMTSGCTIEAHNFERDKDKYSALNAVVHLQAARRPGPQGHRRVRCAGLDQQRQQLRQARYVPHWTGRENCEVLGSEERADAQRRSAGRAPGIEEVNAASRRRKARTLCGETGPFCLPGAA